MHILNVNHSLDPVEGGGTAERTFQISKGLMERGVHCAILTLDNGLSRERLASLEGIKVVALPCWNKRYFIPGLRWQELLNLIADVDIVHLMGHWTLLNAMVFRAACQLGKPYVVCPAGAIPAFGRSALLKWMYNRVVGRELIRRAAAFIAITESEIPPYLALGGVAGKAFVLPNGINVGHFRHQNDAGFRARFLLSDAPFILFVGRLNAIKGPDLLLKAFANLPDSFSRYHLVFAGPDGGMKNELEMTMQKENIAHRVHFIGYIDGVDKSQAFHAADLLVIPSRQEAMSIVVLEAGAAQTPVLLTDQCGFAAVERIGGGKVVAATIQGLQNGLEQILPDPEALRLQGKRLYEFVTLHYSWDRVVQEMIRLYEQILKQ